MGNPVMMLDPNGMAPCPEEWGIEVPCEVSEPDGSIPGEGECAAGIMLNPRRSDLHACYALCVGMGQAEGMALEEFMSSKAQNWENSVCEVSNAKIVKNKIFDMASGAGSILGLVTTSQYIYVCNENFD